LEWFSDNNQRFALILLVAILSAWIVRIRTKDER